MKKITIPLLCLSLYLPVSAQSLAPFGADVKVPAKQEIKALDVKPQVIDCLTPDKASAWVVEAPPEGPTTDLFSLKAIDGKNVLKIPYS